MMAEKTKVTVTTSAGHSEQLLQTRRAEREREREEVSGAISGVANIWTTLPTQPGDIDTSAPGSVRHSALKRANWIIWSLMSTREK